MSRLSARLHQPAPDRRLSHPNLPAYISASFCGVWNANLRSGIKPSRRSAGTLQNSGPHLFHGR